MGGVAWASARIRNLENDLQKEREIRDKDLQKEREIRDKDLQKERELRDKDLQIRDKDVQKERELRQALEERTDLAVKSKLFDILHHADFEAAARVLGVTPPSSQSTKP